MCVKITLALDDAQSRKKGGKIGQRKKRAGGEGKQKSRIKIDCILRASYADWYSI